ncbi:hypothetical protein BKK81_33470 (plasmid) [Cupriavidus sp. USMAHM13]|uniref:AMP-binding protein n=1 Tax=Cupriavidus sp. USMAHM13 TaxID=1389192 RepID=UPI0008A6FD7B|nr:AMP-binding protein [Cupriavidus sp. USMAHM13]AOZ04296.1 hypothetical protein BKK81_33470 [Cupriavidus sp. USMAHM13]
MAAVTPRDLLRLAAQEAAPTTAVASVLAAPVVARIAASNRPPDNVGTLMQLIDWHVATHGDQTDVSFHGAGYLSYRSMHACALSAAAAIARLGLTDGNRVPLMLPTGPEFLGVFYGALYAGCIPVPLYPPVRLAQIEDHMQRSAGILANAEAAILVTVPAARPLLRLLRAQCISPRQILTPPELRGDGALTSLAARGPGDIAFLQCVSGTTGNPKGVVLTHANLLANPRMMERAARVTAADVFVSGLPLYDDMGLIGACIGSLLAGFRLILLSPTDFLARPRHGCGSSTSMAALCQRRRTLPVNCARARSTRWPWPRWTYAPGGSPTMAPSLSALEPWRNSPRALPASASIAPP